MTARLGTRALALGTAVWALLLISLPRVSGAEHTPGVPGWQQRVHYRLDARYDPRRFEIAGVETLTYWNNAPDTLREIYFHLYFNGYRPGSNLARNDARNGDWTVANLNASRWGGGWIDRAALLGGDSLRIHVDDTIARVPLPRALAPGESLAVCLAFRSIVPDVPTRVGRSGRGVFVAQWYPKVCVYDRFGWHREQHLDNEFYGDFGAFDVRLTLPGSFVVAHTGSLANPEEVLPDSILGRLRAPGDSTVTVWDLSRSSVPTDSIARKAAEAPRTWVMHADSVHEFAWAADEKWIWRRARSNGTEVDVYQHAADLPRWNGIPGEASRMLTALAARFGPYPYPRFSVVVEPIGAGGVENPNIVWISPRYHERGSRRLEAVVAHEMAHNWFYGMIGNNETAQAFLDEGFTSYATTVVMETLYGRWGNMALTGKRRWWTPPSDDSRTQARRRYLEFQARGIEEPIDTHADRFKNPAVYYTSSYEKTETGLWALREMVGGDRFDAALREYFATWRFHHPYAEDFYATFERAAGGSYGWFFGGWFTRTDCVDLRLCGLRSFPLDSGRGGEAVASSVGGADSFRVELWLESRGGIDPPVVVALRDGAGHEARRIVPREPFADAAGSVVYRTTLPFEPKGAELDPDLVLPDVSRRDNRTDPWPRLAWQADTWRPVPMPLDRTLVLWRPDLWYQRENAAQVGAAFDASSIRWERGLKGLAGLGVRHARGFFDLEGRSRSLAADPRSVARGRVYDMDGHRGYSASLQRDLGSRIERGLRWRLNVGIDHDRLLDRDVPRRQAEWSDGGFSNLEAGLNASRAFRRAQMTVWLRVRTDLLTERASYGSALVGATGALSAIPKIPLALRAVYGRARGDAIPPEERFYLAGAGPRGEWGSRWFRSRGSIPAHWVAAEGGGGNVRAFADRRPSGTDLVAFNVETRSSRLVPAWIPVLSRLRVPFLDPRSSVFADLGKTTDHPSDLWTDMSADLGVGIRTRALLRNHLVLRCDVPLFRTPPLPEESRWKLRGVFSIGEAF